MRKCRGMLLLSLAICVFCLCSGCNDQNLLLSEQQKADSSEEVLSSEQQKANPAKEALSLEEHKAGVTEEKRSPEKQIENDEETLSQELEIADAIVLLSSRL